MIGQTYLNLDLATAFWSTFTIILQKFEKVLTLFLIPLVVGFLQINLFLCWRKLSKVDK